MANIATDIPGAGQHRDVVKAGFLNKLSGRSFPYIPQWKRRYCVLAKGKLFYYERSDSGGGEKGAGVINLEYFDQVSEAGPKDCKKATNVFIITSQDRSFFDPGRHMFSADTLPDMKDWMRKLQSTLEHIRNNNRTGFSSTPSTPKATKDVSTGGSTGRRKKEITDNTQNTGTSSRERKKKEENSQRRKKPVAISVTSETQTHREVDIPNMKVTEEPVSQAVSQNGNQDENPSNELLPVDGPKLDFVTKRRVRPPGRSNPTSIHHLVENQRAISCSALVEGEHENNSSGPWQNESVDIADDNQAHKSQPQLAAYHYSSDEDEDVQSQTDSLHRSASGLMPAPPIPPPRSASYALELRTSRPQHLSQLRNGSLCSLRDDRGSDVDSQSSQRSLVEVRDAFGGPGDWQSPRKNSASDSKGSIHITERSISMAVAPFGRRSGRASPAMDDLENLLMNQSVQQSVTGDPLECTSSEAASSEGSTCRAVNIHQKQASQVYPQAPPRQQCKSSPDLSRFSTAVRHLQRHVVDMDRAVHGLASDVAGARGDTSALKDAVTAVRNDADLLTVALAEISQEVTATRQQVLSATQETEELQKKTSFALNEAERARQEQIKSKQEYESLVAEIKNSLKRIKEKEGQYDIERQKEAQTINDTSQKGKDQSEKNNIVHNSSNQKTKEQKKDKHGNEVGKEKSSKSQNDQKSSTEKHVKEDKKNANGSIGSPDSPTVTRRVGYQSLFTRPSSIISGLTNRNSLTKSVSFADQKTESSESSKKSKDKNDSLEKKSDSVDKVQSECQGYLDRHTEEQEKKNKDINQNCSQEKKDTKYHKEEKKYSRLEENIKPSHSKDATKIENGSSHSEIKQRSPNKHEDQNQNQNRLIKGSHHPKLCDAGRAISNLSLEDIPMADDTSFERNKAHNTSGNVSTNYILFKSSSTPAVSFNTNVKGNYKSPMNSVREHYNNITPSPATEKAPNLMPSSPTSSRPSSALDDSGTVSDSSFGNIYRPGATPGPLIRQSSMTTVPEDRVVNVNDHTPAKAIYSKRPGVFAISRQNSSPSIPLSHQNSSGRPFPLVRQYSLGQVPEEGGMTRQDSVLSIEGNRPIVDQTLPLSPSSSIANFPISPSSSMNFPISSSSYCTAAGSPTVKQAKVRHSMELVTGPVLAGSAKQEAQSSQFIFPESISTNGIKPNATSSLKKNHKSNKIGREVIL